MLSEILVEPIHTPKKVRLVLVIGLDSDPNRHYGTALKLVGNYDVNRRLHLSRFSNRFKVVLRQIASVAQSFDRFMRL